MDNEEFKEVILKKTRADGLVMSRVPKHTRDEFLEFADEEFAGDYGMTLKYIWDSFKLWKIFFENMDMKLDIIIDRLNSTNEEKPDSFKMMSGRTVMKGGKLKNE